eukprot:TRINITY_DN5765_c0_g1_i1.p2 TRINITY_DN5765_c0_g1~~TRINITY_DN5765_c0_g1_i1.p2  ORF type:complete len:102 (+),score=22.90 TRINITY_DN5765_c0_g1_i1:703-1008(+)
MARLSNPNPKNLEQYINYCRERRMPSDLQISPQPNKGGDIFFKCIIPVPVPGSQLKWEAIAIDRRKQESKIKAAAMFFNILKLLKQGLHGRSSETAKAHRG